MLRSPIIARQPRQSHAMHANVTPRMPMSDAIHANATPATPIAMPITF
jgi:hypothetical protein